MLFYYKENSVSVNKVILIGRLGKDPELKYTPNSKAVLELSLATTEKYKDKEETEWHTVIFWNKQAETLNKYLQKGSLLYVEGKNKTRSWEKDGQKRYKTEVLGVSFQFIGNRTTDSASSSRSKQSVDSDVPKQTLANYKIEADAQMMHDDIPF